ncbi:MAG: ABC transporter permease [Vagococcus fluvialis]
MKNLNHNIIACLGEIKKEHKNYHSSFSNIIALLVWPILTFFFTYYNYESFNINELKKFDINNNNEFIVFLITGALVYNCFWSMVQSAFYLTFERQNGTLDSIFMSPINNMVILYGRALGGMTSSIWMYTSFSVFLLIITSKNINIVTLALIVLILIIILISSTIWGGFVNSLFLISRDSTFLFTLFDEPMNILSGAKIPVQSLPFFFQIISMIFPATYCIYIVRALFLKKEITTFMITAYLISLVATYISTWLILKYAEKKSKKTGTLQIY